MYSETLINSLQQSIHFDLLFIQNVNAFNEAEGCVCVAVVSLVQVFFFLHIKYIHPLVGWLVGWCILRVRADDDERFFRIAYGVHRRKPKQLCRGFF